MSKDHLRGILVIIGLMGIGFVVGIAVVESPEDAYERGKTQGYLAGSYRITEIVDEQFESNVIEYWEYNIRNCLGDDVVDEFLAGMVDSTDTMPAVDNVDTFIPLIVCTVYSDSFGSRLPTAEELDSAYRAWVDSIETMPTVDWLPIILPDTGGVR